MVFEILGVNLLEIMKRYDYRGIPIPIVRRMAKQVLIGLDYLHRYCKIIHTDLKPENVIVSLTREELQEIVDRGQISTMNRNVKTLDVERLFGGAAPKNRQTTGGILSGIDTEGMSKAQKKKLKAKLKKKMQEKDSRSKANDESDKEDSNPFAVASDAKQKNDDPNFGMEAPEMPRSFSLPGLASNLNESRH